MHKTVDEKWMEDDIRMLLPLQNIVASNPMFKLNIPVVKHVKVRRKHKGFVNVTEIMYDGDFIRSPMIIVSKSGDETFTRFIVSHLDNVKVFDIYMNKLLNHAIQTNTSIMFSVHGQRTCLEGIDRFRATDKVPPPNKYEYKLNNEMYCTYDFVLNSGACSIPDEE